MPAPGGDEEELLEAEVIAEERRDRRSFRRVLFTILLLAAVLLLAWWQRERIGGWFAGLLADDHRRPLPVTSSDTPADASNRERVGIPAAPREQAARIPHTRDDSKALADLENRLARLEDRQATLARQLQDLTRDLAALARREGGRAAAPHPDWLLAVTLARIALKLESGGDLLAERLALQALLPTLPETARDEATALLAATADPATALPGRARLLALFDRAAQALRSRERPADGGSWWRRWLAALRHLVQVRRHDRPGEAADARDSLEAGALALARARFLAGDLDQAVDALSSLGSNVDPLTARLRRQLIQRRALLRALQALLAQLEQEATSTPAGGHAPDAAGGGSDRTTEEQGWP